MIGDGQTTDVTTTIDLQPASFMSHESNMCASGGEMRRVFGGKLNGALSKKIAETYSIRLRPLAF
jgi:hypothetical protein